MPLGLTAVESAEDAYVLKSGSQHKNENLKWRNEKCKNS